MARVVKPGGTVAAYAWDMFGGGFPQEPVFAELRAMGFSPPGPPSPEASKREVMQELWTAAGLRDVETRVIKVERSYPSFDDFWDGLQGSPSIKAAVAQFAPAQSQELKDRVRGRFSPATDGSITYPAWSNAVKGRVAQ
jgi:hypothetical protein